MAYQAPRNVGDTHPLIPAAKRKLAGNSYGKAIGDDRSDVYTEAFGAALIQYGKNVHDLVLAGRRPGPDVNVEGIFDWAIQRQMELTAPPAPPAPPRDRALAYVWRGTGGIIGQDLVSLVCQGVADLVDEVNPPWAATMGGIPVGVAGGIGDPSVRLSRTRNIAVRQPLRAETARRVDPGKPSVVTDCVANAKVRAWRIFQ